MGGHPTPRRYLIVMRHAIAIEDMPPTDEGRVGDKPTEALGPEGLSSAADPARFDAILYPNRSLPNRGFAIVMAVVIASNIGFGGYFYALGAWPVIGFCGLDVFLVWLAFKVSYRQGRLHERVIVTPDEMRVSRVLPSGHENRWVLQPFWTTVTIDDPVRHESQVQVRSRGRTLILGSFLSPGERVAFANALSGALASCRIAPSNDEKDDQNQPVRGE
ncbi:MAG: DUF2244 domain-containing protein [Pseudomonadota bacterium]